MLLFLSCFVVLVVKLKSFHGVCDIELIEIVHCATQQPAIYDFLDI